MTITVRASDNAAVTAIGAYANDKTISLDENNSALITPTESGVLVVTAKAYDAAGNVGVATREITVQPDTTPPSISISTTAAKVQAGTVFTITVNALDNVGVTKIEAYMDDVLIILNEENKYTYVPQKDGIIVIMAKVYDAAGNTKETQINITVTPDTIKPIVKLSLDKDMVELGKHVGFTDRYIV